MPSPEEIDNIRDLLSQDDLHNVNLGLELLDILCAEDESLFLNIAMDKDFIDSMMKKKDLEIVKIGLGFVQKIIQTSPQSSNFLRQVYPTCIEEYSPEYIHTPYIYIIVLARRIEEVEQNQDKPPKGKPVLQYKNVLEIPTHPEHILEEIPPEIGKLTQLTTLSIEDQPVAELPAELFLLTKLKTLRITTGVQGDGDITELPKDIAKLKELDLLDLSGNQLTTIPDNIGELSQLRVLGLNGNFITEIPLSVYGLTKLTELGISVNNITVISPEITKLRKLKILNLTNNPIKTLPKGIKKLGITSLNIDKTLISKEEAKFLKTPPPNYISLVTGILFSILFIVACIQYLPFFLPEFFPFLLPELITPDIVSTLIESRSYDVSWSRWIYSIQLEETNGFFFHIKDSSKLVWLTIVIISLPFGIIPIFIDLENKANLQRSNIIRTLMALRPLIICLLILAICFSWVAFERKIHIDPNGNITMENSKFFGYYTFRKTTTVEKIEQLHLSPDIGKGYAYGSYVLILKLDQGYQVISPNFPVEEKDNLYLFCQSLSKKLKIPCDTSIEFF